MKKLLIIFTLSLTLPLQVEAGFFDWLFGPNEQPNEPLVIVGAPSQTFQRSLIPIDSTENLGTSTAPWDELHVNEICLSADCKTAWPSGAGGNSKWATSSTNKFIHPTNPLTHQVSIGTTTGIFANTVLTVTSTSSDPGFQWLIAGLDETGTQRFGLGDDGSVNIYSDAPYFDLVETDSGEFGEISMSAGNLLITAGTQSNDYIRFMNDIDLQGISISGSLIPIAPDQYQIGSNDFPWQGVYLGPDECINFGAGGSTRCLLGESVPASPGSGDTLVFYSQGEYSSGRLGISTSTPRWSLNIASSTNPQLTLSTGTGGQNHWSFRNAGGIFYLATSSDSTYATSTTNALSFNTSGQPSLPFLKSCNTIDTDATGLLSCGDDDTGGGGSIFGEAWQLFSNKAWLAPTTTVGIIVNASSTFQGGLTVDRATTTSATTTNLAFTGLTSSLLAVNPTGQVIASSTIGNAQLQNSSIIFTTAAPLGGAATVSLGGTLALTCTGCLTANQTITLSGDVTGSGATSIVTAINPATRDWTLFSPTVLQPTTTPMGILVNNSTSTITNLMMVNSTSTNATSTNLYVSGTTRLASLNGILKGTTGNVSAASNGSDYTLISALTCTGNDKFSAVTADGTFTCTTDQTGAGGSSFGQAWELYGSGTYLAPTTTKGIIVNASSTISNLTMRTGTSTETYTVGTTTDYEVNGLQAKLFVVDTSGSLGSSYGMVRIKSTDTSGGNFDIRIDSPDADVELIETDQTSPAGKWELEAQGKAFTINSRNAADNSFERSVSFGAYKDGGQVGIGTQFDTIFNDSVLTIVATSTLTNAIDVSSGTIGNGNIFLVRRSGQVGISTTSPWAKLSVGNANSAASTKVPLFVVASSSASVATSTYFVIDAFGNVGISTSSPWAKLSVVGGGNEISPTFVVATTSVWNNSQYPLIFAFATTSGSTTNSRIGFGTSTAAAGGLRDNYTFDGNVKSTWRTLYCGASGIPLGIVGVDTSGACGDFAFDVDADANLNEAVRQATGSPYMRMRAGAASVGAGDTGALRSGMIAAASSTPRFEAQVRVGTAPADPDVYFMVGMDNRVGGTDYSTIPTDGIFFAASTTNHWRAITRNGNAETMTNLTSVATSTFAILRIEVESTTLVKFLVNGEVVATHTTNIPDDSLAPLISAAAVNTGGVARDIDISYIYFTQKN